MLIACTLQTLSIGLIYFMWPAHCKMLLLMILHYIAICCVYIEYGLLLKKSCCYCLCIANSLENANNCYSCFTFYVIHAWKNRFSFVFAFHINLQVTGPRIAESKSWFFTFVHGAQNLQIPDSALSEFRILYLVFLRWMWLTHHDILLLLFIDSM